MSAYFHKKTLLTYVHSLNTCRRLHTGFIFDIKYYVVSLSVTQDD